VVGRRLNFTVRAPRVPPLDYQLLEGRISDQRVPIWRYGWDFAVDDTPVRLVGGGSGLIDAMAKGRHVIVAGRRSLLGRRRLIAYRLWVRETGVTIGVPIAAGAISLLIQIVGFAVVLATGDGRAIVLLGLLLLAGIPAAALLTYDAYRCGTLMKVVGSDAST
jgi:hypothetical protein